MGITKTDYMRGMQCPRMLWLDKHKPEERIIPPQVQQRLDEGNAFGDAAIDFARTRNNYNVIKRQCSYTQHINKRIAELDLPTKVRKDAVLMCSFVVGSDREFFKSLSAREQEKFFADCTRFFADRYGEENIISAVVHMDETTPHLHLNLIPIAEGRLCAKQLFDRKALQTLQTDFYSVVGKKWNLQRGKELEYSIKDQHDVFQLYQKTERERLSLQEDAKTLRELREQAPDKLREALATAEQRKSAKHSSSFKSFGNGWSK